MPFRLHGTGTTIGRIPKQDEETIAILWFTFAYIPLVPLEWQRIRGLGGRSYILVRHMTKEEVINELGPDETKRRKWRAFIPAFIVFLLIQLLYVAASNNWLPDFSD